MTRGCGILVAAAFATTATWPSPTPCHSSSSRVAWGFLTTTLPPASFSPATARRRAVHSRRCRSWSPAATAPAAAGEQGESIFGRDRRPLRMIGAFEGEGAKPGVGITKRRVLPFSSRCRHNSFYGREGGIGRRTFALSGASSSSSSSNGDGGDGGSFGRVGGLDPESVARAREAAKNDDYDWFMEFIEGGEDSGEDGGGESGFEGSTRGPVAGVVKNVDGGSGGGDARLRPAPKGDRRQQGNNGRFSSGSNSRYGEVLDSIDGNGAGAPAGVSPRRRRPPPLARGFQQPPANGDGRRRGRQPSTADADSAYDYDLDDEYDREPGRGGWDYDPGLSAGIGERRRDVEVDKVRAKTKPASMRLPLEDDQEDVAARMGQRAEALPGGAGAATTAAANFEPVSSEKAKVLVEDLGYTEPEVACMDPDMADLAIERAIRRPVSGMPADWVAVGMPPPLNTPGAAGATSSASSSSVSSQTYFGEGAAGTAGAGSFDSNGAAGEVDGGALDLDAILGDGFDDDYDDAGNSRSQRRQASPRDRPAYSSGEWRGNREQERGGTRGQGGAPSRRDPAAYSQDGGGRQQRREGGRGDGGYGYDDDIYARGADPYYYEDEGAPRNGGRARGYAGEDARDGGGRGRRSDVGRGGQAAGRPRRRKEEREPEISAAERYEKEVFGGLGGGATGGGGGGGGWGRDEEDEDAKLWTGVGPDGPWPTMEEFTKLLREETEVRLGLVGPWAAEVVSVENRFRLQAYEKWLEVLDKGIGATLEEAGVFDAAFSTEDDEYDDDYSDGGRGRGGGAGGRGFSPGTNNNNLYDKYTNYDYRSSGDGGGRRDEGRGGGDGYGYDPQGRQDERGFDYDDRYGGGDGSYRQRSRRPKAPGRQKFDVGSFLRSGAQNIMQPGLGMEDKAAEFERRYPGRTRSNALGYGEEDDDYSGGSNVRNNSDQEFDRRRGRQARRKGEPSDDELRGRNPARGEGRGSWTQAGYQDEDEYEY